MDSAPPPPPIFRKKPTPEAHPVVNSPYSEPRYHWKLGEDGQALSGENAELLEGRRTSASRTMVPDVKSTGSQSSLVQEGEEHEFVNEVRKAVREWRQKGRPGLSRVSRNLLKHWELPPDKNGPRKRLFFAQLEAIETLMWLHEVRVSVTGPFIKRLEEENLGHNEGCNRLAVRMATGTGKTMVMAMLIVWHTLLYLRGGKKHREKHAKTFIIITPGITVRERLQELDPSKRGNIFDAVNLVPARYREDINQACVRVINFQAFRQRDPLEGASAEQKKMFERRRRQKRDWSEYREAYGTMLERVLNLPSASKPGERNLVLLNDEAHHCYGDVPEATLARNRPRRDGRQAAPAEQPKLSKEAKAEAAKARQWFKILKGLHDQGRLVVAHDLSATPYYVSHQWIRFPWIVSDYDLHEAMEAGLVKIPRVPVSDDVGTEDVQLRNLYKNTHPKKLQRNPMSHLVEKAMETLYNSYESRVHDWRVAGHEHLPVLIIVANNISNAIALYDWISGYKTKDGWVQGAFPLLSNVDEYHDFKSSPATILVHSEKLEKEEAKLDGANADRMRFLAEQISIARKEKKQPENNVEKASYLRRVLNTVGKEDSPGEHIRCVVSVGMLTEGWDVRTVTHILGFRAFSSPLLCEQVAGRALRRVNYVSTEKFAGEDVLKAEYSEILGIPFQFSESAYPDPPPPPEKTIEVFTQRDHEHHRISWPQVEWYRRCIKPGHIRLNPQRVEPFDASISQDAPTESELAGVVGEVKKLAAPEYQQQRVHYEFVRHVMRHLHQDDKPDAEVPPNLRRFAQLLIAVREWTKQPQVKTASPWWQLIAPALRQKAIEAFIHACDNLDGDRFQITVDLAHPPEMDTSNVFFVASVSGEMPGRQSGPQAWPPSKPGMNRPRCKSSELSFAVCDSYLEMEIARTLDSDALEGAVLAWVRNHLLGWAVPWLDKRGVWHEYIPDFVVRLTDCPETGERRQLVLEGKGFDDPDWEEKRSTLLNYWMPGVRGSSEYACEGQWSFLEVRPSSQQHLVDADPEWLCTVNDLAPKLRQLAENRDAWKER